MGVDADKDLASHFEFGENWVAYAQSIDARRIHKAEQALLTLVDKDTLQGARFLDIGCGSGLHSLAALNLGVASVRAFDIDPNSVAATRAVLQAHSERANYEVAQGSVFELPLDAQERFDVVYSWGVLHHTGDMWTAVENAAKFVRPGGRLVIALYLKTRFCGFWRAEKRLFTALPKVLRYPIIWLYCAICWLRILLKGQSPFEHIKNYQQDRGMNWYHDRIDWLGGYPYESATPDEVEAFVGNLGGTLEVSQNTQTGIGLLSIGCAEYVFNF